MFIDYVVSYLVFFNSVLPRQLLLFPTCSDVSRVWKHCIFLQEGWHSSSDIISKGSLQWLKCLEFPQRTLSAFSVGFWDLRVWLCLPLLEECCPAYRLPAQLPRSLRKAAWTSQGCKLLCKCYSQSQIHVWFIQDSEPLRRTDVANKDRKSRWFTYSLILLSISC